MNCQAPLRLRNRITALPGDNVPAPSGLASEDIQLTCMSRIKRKVYHQFDLHGSSRGRSEPSGLPQHKPWSSDGLELGLTASKKPVKLIKCQPWITRSNHEWCVWRVPIVMNIKEGGFALTASFDKRIRALVDYKNHSSAIISIGLSQCGKSQ